MRVVGFEEAARDGGARTGLAHTLRGTYETPCFMPVGTRGAVKLLDAADLGALGATVVLANTYHLMLRPGADVVAELGGLHGFTGWKGHFLTDSGGFQVFSLSPAVDDEGVTFKSTYDGSTHRLTPESAVAVQEKLGADIQMCLDVCCGLPAGEDTVRLAMERTVGWAGRARRSHVDDGQSLFGIVQGGVSPGMREECAGRLGEMGFDGYGIGGLSVGEPRHEMLPALAAAVRALPPARLRYLMGVGDPVSIVEAIALGVDMFDCVLPTRLARHGTALTSAGKVQVKAVRHARSAAPIDAECACPVCAAHSVGYLRHLFLVGEPTAGRLLTIHNLAWLFQLIEKARRAIRRGTFAELQASVVDLWEPRPLR